jgi:hypothetical protein
MLNTGWTWEGMGRSLPLLRQALLLPVSLAAFCLGGLGVAAQGQPMPSPGRRSVEVMQGSPESAPAPEPATAPNIPVHRYKVKLLSWQGSAYESWESWIVFDVRRGTTILFLRHSTTDGFKWWDHPVLSAKACRIIQADGGERLVDCVQAVRDDPTTPLRIVLPQAVALQDCLLAFTWMESGRIQEGLIRINQGLIPDVRGMGPAQKPEVINQPLGPLPPDSGGWRYKVKLSKGHAWQTLRPESWVVLDVIGGRTVTMKHTTNSYNLIMGLSRWWDHPVLSSVACPLWPDGAGERLADCLHGSSSGPGEPLRIVLPQGASLHDYRFSFTWQEDGRIQDGTTIVEPTVKPSLIPSR